MAKQSYPIPESNPNAHMSATFLLLWLVNVLIIWLANTVFPDNFVLGTMSLSSGTALLLSSGVLAWIVTLLIPVFTEIEIRKQMVLTPQHWVAGYLIINTVALWSVARFADVLGFGISSWAYVLGLAVVLNLIQGMVMMGYGEVQKKFGAV
ncbi:MAG: hypothetical protein WDZ94_03635 [Patescibacteria group bacterium]